MSKGRIAKMVMIMEQFIYHNIDDIISAIWFTNVRYIFHMEGHQNEIKDQNFRRD